MGADVARSPEALRLVDGGPEGERSDRPDAGSAHKAATNSVSANRVENLLGQRGELLADCGEDDQERRDQRLDARIIPGSHGRPRRGRSPSGAAS